MSEEALELIIPDAPVELVADRQPRMPETLPVKLVTIDDATLPAAAGVERALDAFYVGLLRFQRAADLHQIIYQAENFDLHFSVLEAPVAHESLRALGIEVQSLATIEVELIARQIEYTRQRTLVPGQISLLVLDPAGNWIELTESRAI